MKQAQEGKKSSLGNSEPSYILTAGTGWRIGVSEDGIRMNRGTYYMRESEIVEVVK